MSYKLNLFSEHMPYVYILLSERSGRFYIGSTPDIKDRLDRHNAGMNLATKAYRPWKIIYTEEFSSLPAARKRESDIKKWKNRSYMIKTLGLKI